MIVHYALCIVHCWMIMHYALSIVHFALSIAIYKTHKKAFCVN